MTDKAGRHEIEAAAGLAPGGGDYGGLAMPRFSGPVHPLVDFVAGIRASVQIKLLGGFLVGVLLLLAMGILSLVVINRMSSSFVEVTLQQEKVDLARQMESAVTTQMSNRAMSLLTGDVPNNAKTVDAQERFLENLRRVAEITEDETIQVGWTLSSLEQIQQKFEQFRQVGGEVLDRYDQGDVDGALALHISAEQPIAHDLEDATGALVAQATVDTVEAADAFQSDRDLLQRVVWGFWGVSLAITLLLGFVLSWSFIRPVRRIGSVLAGVAGGDFTSRVEVPNRDEFGTLGADVNRMIQQLEHMFDELAATNQELEAFSYSVSHDLRAPLRSIDGFSQALLEDYSDKIDDQATDYLQRVRAGSQRMGQLIDDLLALSRVSRSEILREEVDLSEVARTIAAELQAREPERRVEFVIQDGVVANGDTRLLRVALENLLGNAWKFTGKRDQARIEFGLTEHDGQQACFVRDDGAGFDMAYADKLFGAFQRLHHNSEFQGEGIGLATVQRVMHRHGGQVWAEGAPDQGATFYFTLT